MKITLDTNCIINLLDQESATATSYEAIAGLIQLALSGRAQISITTRVEADIARDRDAGRRTEMLRQLRMFPVVGTVGRWDVSSWDSGDIWASDATMRIEEELAKLIFLGLGTTDTRYSNKINDIDHLVGHLINKRDVFVTDDRGILRRADALRISPGIVVMTPAACLDFAELIYANKQQRSLESDGQDTRYRSTALRGRVTLDYSNNDHRFSIGVGVFLFETRWSKASDTSIHAYTDAPSIAGVALARGAKSISEIRDAATFDYSSRVRTPSTGQVVLWRNVNGFYAATKIIDVKDDKRGAPADELTFEYVILDGGGADFAE